MISRGNLTRFLQEGEDCYLMYSFLHPSFDFPNTFILELVMVRVITQILIGLMLVFGFITLGYRVLFYIAKGRILKALYFLLPCSIALFFAVLAFHYVYSGIVEIWK